MTNCRIIFNCRRTVKPPLTIIIMSSMTLVSVFKVLLFISSCLLVIPTLQQIASALTNGNNNNNVNYNINRNQARDQEHNMLGHHNFEVAPPGVEPPTVRKPPYTPASFGCPGVDPWEQFSAKDTLCGDLNKGFIPRNPLNQDIMNQPYPFELIKNKTLQFLANALPMLKAEYQTIPKVARYVPDLNPTNVHNTMSFDQLQQLNQLNGISSSNVPSLPSSFNVGAGVSHLFNTNDYQPSYLTRAKRSLSLSSSSSSSSSTPSSSSHSPVTSSSSSPSTTTSSNVMRVHGNSRINRNDDSNEHQHTTNNNNNNNNHNGYRHGQATIISKDGFRNVTTLPLMSSRQQQPQQQSITSVSYGVSQVVAAGSSKPTTSASVSVGFAPDNVQNGLATTNRSPMQQSSMELHARDNSNSISANDNTSNSNSNKNGRSASSSASSSSTSSHQNNAGSQLQQQHQSISLTNNKEKLKQPQQAAAASPATAPCSELSTWNGLVCQAALALIEGEKSPLLSTVKQVANAYSSASDAASSGSSIWSAITSIFQDSSIGKAGLTSGRIGIPQIWSAISSYNANSNQLTKDNNNNNGAGFGGGGSGYGLASSAINQLVEYFLPSLSPMNAFAKRKKPFDAHEIFVDTPASAASNQNPISAQQVASATTNNVNNNLATPQLGPGGSFGKPPPTPCQSVEEYISPTFARNYQGAWKYVVQIPHEGYFTQTIQKTTCVKSRCDFTEGVCHESPRWISLLVAEIFYPNTVFGQNGMAGSVGQHSTDLQQLQQQVPSPSASSNNVHMIQMGSTGAINAPKPMNNDPLQMTDTFQNINYQINNAFANNADPNSIMASADAQNSATMNSLANSYHQYQLLQRQGLIPNSPSAYNVQPSFHQPNVNQLNNQQHQKMINSQYMNANNAGFANSLGSYADYSSAMLGNTPQNILMKRKRRDVSGVQKSVMVSHSNNNDNIVSSNDIHQMIGHSVGQVAQMQHPTHLLASQPPMQQQQQQQQQPPVNFNQRNQQSFNNNMGADQSSPSTTTTSSNDNQVECDGHDKIGCYVVRVYYDWFLVNGSCKCWKTQTPQAASNPSNSFIRRIFNG